MKTGKRLLAILLSVGMILTTGPGFVLAEEIAGTDTGGNAAVTDTVSNNVVRSEATDAEDFSAPPQKDNAGDAIQSEAKDPEDSSAAPQKDEEAAPQKDNAGDAIQSEAKDPEDSSAAPQNDKETGTQNDKAAGDVIPGEAKDLKDNAEPKGSNAAGPQNEAKDALTGSVEETVVALMDASENSEEGEEPEPTVDENENEVLLFDGEKTITVTSKSMERAYDGAEYTLEGFVNESMTFTVEGETYTVSGLSARVSGKDADTYVNEITGTPVVMDSEGSDVTEQFTIIRDPGTLTINKRAVTLTSATATKEYDGTALTADEVTVGGAGFVGTDNVTPIFPDSVHQTEVGFCENRFSYTFTEGTNGNNYAITPAFGRLTVNPRAITVESNGDKVEYDGKLHSVSGFKTLEFTAGGNTFTVSGLTASGAEGTDAGNYENVITGTAVVADAAGVDVTDNFSVTLKDGELIIEPAKVTVTITGRSKETEYNGSVQSLKGYTTQLAGSSLYDEDSIVLDTTGLTMEDGQPVARGTEAGRYTMGLSKERFSNTDDNFDVTFEVTDGVLVIKESQAKIVVTSKSDSKKYDGTPLKNGEVTVTGLPAGFTYEARTGGSVTNVDDTDTTNRIVSFRIFDGNGQDVTGQFPSITKVAGKLTIEPRQVTLTSQSGSKLYEEGVTLKLPEVTVDGDGFVAGEATAEAIGEATQVGVPVTNTIRIIPGANYNEHNYDITKSEGILILKHEADEVFLIAGSAVQTYNGKALTDPEVRAVGLPEGYSYTATATGSQTDAGESPNKVADGYKITDGSGADVTSGTNITCIDGTLTVTVRTVLVRSESDVKEYDGKPLTNSNWSATGLAEGDSEDSIRVQVSGSQTDCGTSPNTISCEWAANPGFNTENYKLTALPGTLEVQENTSLITIWPDRLKKPYDGQPFSPLTYHVTGLPGGFSVQATVESEDPGWSEVGSVWVWIGDDYAIINDATGKDVTKFFEYVALPEVELVIERAPVTVKADNKYKTVGDEDPALTATVTGLVNGEAVKYDLSRAEGERVGRYTITPSGEELQGSHYIVTYETGTFTITSASNGGGGTPVTPDDPLIYTITYDDGTSTVTEQYPEGTVVSLTRTPVKDGYRFTGWYADPQLTEWVTRITVGEDMTLYAGWEELQQHETRTVTFDDGTKQTTSQVEAGTTIRLTETPEREGYRFTGWYTDPEKTHRVTRVKVDDDITLYAGWEKIDNGGSNDNNGGNNNGTPGNNSGSKGRTGRTVTPSSGSGNGGGTNVAPGGSGGSDGSGGTDIKDDDTPKTDGKDDGTKIDDDDVPKAWDDGQWALMNLVLAILAALLGAGTLAGWFRRKHEDRLVGLVSAITAIAVFLATEDMSQPMCMADKWTPLMALIVGAAAAAAFVPGSEKKRKSR